VAKPRKQTVMHEGFLTWVFAPGDTRLRDGGKASDPRRLRTRSAALEEAKRRCQEIGGPREWKAARGDCGTARTGSIVRSIDDQASASGKAGGAEFRV
jgi:hypothetical protein